MNGVASSGFNSSGSHGPAATINCLPWQVPRSVTTVTAPSAWLKEATVSFNRNSAPRAVAACNWAVMQFSGRAKPPTVSWYAWSPSLKLKAG